MKRKLNNNKNKDINKSINLQERILYNFFDNTKYRAVIYNKNYEQIAIIKLDRKNKTFKFNNGSYNVDYTQKTYFKRSNILNNFKYFYYREDLCDPITFNANDQEFSPELFNNMLETKVIRDLNNVNNKFSDLLTPKNILIGLGVIAVGYYFLSGGTLT